MVATPPHAGPELTPDYDRLLAVIDEFGAVARVSPATREEARTNALALLAAADGGGDASAHAMLGYAADLLGAVTVDLAANPEQARRLIESLEARAPVSRVALGREMLRGGRLAELPVDVAIEVQLQLLLAFGSAGAISLWTVSPENRPAHIAHAGPLDRHATATVAAAHAVLESRTGRPVAGRGTLGCRVEGLRPPVAALVAHGVEPGGALTAALLPAAAPAVAALLERERLLAGEHSQDSVLGIVERRLARLRFDLHDGPQQEVHLLAADLRLFRDQLRPLIAGDPNEHRVVGRLDDLEAQLVALDGDLRRLSSSVQSPLLSPGSLREALAQLTDAFAARTGIVPDTSFGELPTPLSDSQQIAMLALVREALSNVRKHSAARGVAIVIGSDRDGVQVQVTDDGDGFDPEATLVRAARAGHLGLVGMHERVRMLGGRTQIDSRPGGPTVISATLPPWPAPRD